MAKQANKPFLIMLTLGFLIAGVGGFFGVQWIRHHRRGDPAKLIEEGRSLLQDKKANDAAGKFGQAAMLAPKDPLPVSLFGDALYILGQDEPELIPKAVAQWDAALQMDPNFVPALKSKLDANIESMEVYQRVANFNAVRDIASRLSKLEPTYTKAVSYQYIATLAAWMNNQPTPPEKITEAMDGLRELAKADPGDSTMPYQIARGLIQMGQDEARVQGNITAAKAHYVDAGKVMDDAVKNQQGNVMLLLRAGQIYSILDDIYPKAESQGRFDKLAGDYMDRARAQSSPSDKNFQEVQTVYGSRKLQRGDQAEAEKVFRDLLNKVPGDTSIRLVLAEILQASRISRKEAADLLARTVTDGEKPDAPRSAIARALHLRAIMRLASVRMDLLEDINDPAQYKAAIAQIEADVAKAESKMPENPESLKIRGRLYLVKGDVQNAVTTLNKATLMLDQMSARRDYELVYSLARAQLAAQQNDDAKRNLRQVVQAFPSYTPARSLLVDVLINSNEMAEAAGHIDELDKRLPGSATVARYRILTLDSKKDRSVIDGLFTQLPEDNRQQMLEKARIAVIINRIDDAIKLMEGLRGQNPKDVRIADRLARLYLYKNDRDHARNVLDEALQIAPRDAELLILRKRLDNATPGEIMDLVRSLIEETADPLTRELQMADLERLRGNGEELYKHLVAAEKLAPNDPRVQEQLFTYYLATNQFDAAAKYVDPLTKANYGGSQGLIYRWKLAVAKRDYATAIAVGRDFTQKMPEFATSWITLGQALKLNGMHEEALRCFNTARDHQSANRDAIRGAIDCLYSLKREAEALKIIEDALRFYPTDLTLREMQLEAWLKIGKPELAMKPLLDDLQAHPDEVIRYLNVASMYYRMSIKSDQSAQQQADYLAKGILTLKTAVGKFPDEMQPYINLAELQGINRDRAAAEATLKAMCAQEKLKQVPYPRLILAEFYLKGDQPELAEQPLRDAVEVAKKSPEIRRRLSVYLSQRGRVGDAIKVIDDAPDKQAFEPLLLTARLEILSAAGRFVDCEESANLALSGKPNEPEWLAILANAQYNQGKFEASLVTAEKALAADPNSRRALLLKAMSNLKRPGADLTVAVRDLESYRNQNPGDGNVRRLIAETYMTLQRPDDAIRELEGGLQAAPADRQMRAALLEYYRTAKPPRWGDGDQVLKSAQAIESLMKDPEWLTAESAWLVNRKQWPAAVEKMRQALKLSPNEAKIAQTYLTVLLNTKNEAALIQESESMLKAMPDRWWIYQARALARMALKDPAGAEAEYRRAAVVAMAAKDAQSVLTVMGSMSRELGADRAISVIEPHASEDLQYMICLASLYRKKEDRATTAKWVDQAMTNVDAASAENQAAVLSFAGLIYSTMEPRQIEKALSAYQKLVKLQPENPDALNQLAWLLAVDMTPSKPAEALQYSQRAYDVLFKLNRFSATVYDTHGWVLVLAGKPQEGIAILKKVVEQAPSAESYYHLGEGYLRAGKADDALAQFEHSKQLMDEASSNKQAVDPALKQAVEAALQKNGAKN